MLILGIDPGSLITGYGLIEIKNGDFFHRKHGIFQLNKNLSLAHRLKILSERLEELFLTHKPQETVIEKIFFDKNAHSAFQLGHVRGICLLKAFQNQSEIYEYATKTVKKSITGKGSAQKNHVRFFIQKIFNLDENSLDIDASDALALALTRVKKREVLLWLKEGSIQKMESF